MIRHAWVVVGAALTSNITIYNTSLTSLLVVNKNRCILHCDTRLSQPITTGGNIQIWNYYFFKFWKLRMYLYIHVISSLVCVFLFQLTSQPLPYTDISSLPSNIDLRPWFHMMLKLQPIIFQLWNGGEAQLTSNITAFYTTSLTSLPAANKKGCILHTDTLLLLPVTTAATSEFEILKTPYVYSCYFITHLCFLFQLTSQPLPYIDMTRFLHYHLTLTYDLDFIWW
jgi:hypothetical protein